MEVTCKYHKRTRVCFPESQKACQENHLSGDVWKQSALRGLQSSISPTFAVKGTKGTSSLSCGLGDRVISSKVGKSLPLLIPYSRARLLFSLKTSTSPSFQPKLPSSIVQSRFQFRGRNYGTECGDQCGSCGCILDIQGVGVAAVSSPAWGAFSEEGWSLRLWGLGV